MPLLKYNSAGQLKDLNWSSSSVFCRRPACRDKFFLLGFEEEVLVS